MSVVLFSLSRFQSTPSTRRVTRGVGSYCLTTAFQSTPSTRRVTHERNGGGAGILFQSTPSTRRVTESIDALDSTPIISIHTLHTEGDIIQMELSNLPSDISIHTLHTEGDHIPPYLLLLSIQFQSTPSTRRVTPAPPIIATVSKFQSTPSTRRVT